MTFKNYLYFLKTLKYNKFIMLLLLMIAFIGLNLTQSVYFNENDLQYNYASKNSLKYVGVWHECDDLNYLALNDTDFIKVVSGNDLNILDALHLSQYENVNNIVINQYYDDFSFIIGRAPMPNQPKKEIVISRLLAERIIELGNSNYLDIEDFLNFNLDKYIITGVYEDNSNSYKRKNDSGFHEEMYYKIADYANYAMMNSVDVDFEILSENVLIKIDNNYNRVMRFLKDNDAILASSVSINSFVFLVNEWNFLIVFTQILIKVITILLVFFLINYLFSNFKKDFMLLRSFGLSRKDLMISIALVLQCLLLASAIIGFAVTTVIRHSMSQVVSINQFKTKLNLFLFDYHSLYFQLRIFLFANIIFIFKFRNILKSSISEALKEINQ